MTYVNRKPQNLAGVRKRKEGGRERHSEAISMSVSFKNRTRTWLFVTGHVDGLQDQITLCT